jgi:hypothetical protein
MAGLARDRKHRADGDPGPDTDGLPAAGAIPLEGDEGEPFPPLPDPQESSDSQGGGDPRCVRRNDAYKGGHRQPGPEKAGRLENTPTPAPGQNLERGVPGREPEKVQRAGQRPDRVRFVHFRCPFPPVLPQGD